MYDQSRDDYENYLNKNIEFFEKVVPVYPDIHPSDESKKMISDIFGRGATTPKEKIKKLLQKEINKNSSVLNYIFKIENSTQNKIKRKKITILGFIKLSFKAKK